MILRKTKLIRIGNETFVDVRSDEVTRHRAKKSDMRIIVGDEYCDIPYGKLRWGKKITKEVFQMIYPPFEKYTLISFRWSNPQKLTSLQIKLLT
mgnify:CR=1 FL=1